MSSYVVKVIGTLDNGCYANGSGFICSQNGHILTCAHNVAHVKSIQIYYKQALCKATLIAVDNRLDLAVVKIDKSTNTPKIAMCAQYGKCFTYGYHQDHVSLSYQEGSLMTRNHVSNHSIDSTLTTIRGFKGASGSPIYNEDNEVIGIFSYESSIGSGGVVCRLIHQFLQQVNESSKYVHMKRSHIGYVSQSIGIDYILEHNIEFLKTQVKGEKIIKVLNADDGELKENDIIIAINNNPVGRNHISSESCVLYMDISSTVKVDYLQSPDYNRKTCKISLIDFPKYYDKPLSDTTILALSF